LVLADLCVLQCLLAWLIVANATPLRASTIPALALLILASGVGAALGLFILVLAPRPAVACAIVPAVVLLLWLFGGQTPTPSTVVSGLDPARWAFEGLLLLESDEHTAASAADGSDVSIDHDLAEKYFPSQTEQMGLKADALALGAMLIGLAAAVSFISISTEPDRRTLQAR
jgi:hypothetical protein